MMRELVGLSVEKALFGVFVCSMEFHLSRTGLSKGHFVLFRDFVRNTLK